MIEVSERCEDGCLGMSSFPELGRKNVIDDQKQRPLKRSNQRFFLKVFTPLTSVCCVAVTVYEVAFQKYTFKATWDEPV